MVAAPAKPGAAFPPLSLTLVRPVLKPFAVIVGLSLLFWLIGPPHFLETTIAKVFRLTYAVLVLACVRRAAAGVALPVRWRWVVLALVALVLKDRLAPYSLVPLNLFSDGGVVPGFFANFEAFFSRLLVVVVLAGAAAGIYWLAKNRERLGTAKAAGYAPPMQTPMPRPPVAVSDVHGSGGIASGNDDAKKA